MPGFLWPFKCELRIPYFCGYFSLNKNAKQCAYILKFKSVRVNNLNKIQFVQVLVLSRVCSIQNISIVDIVVKYNSYRIPWQVYSERKTFIIASYCQSFGQSFGYFSYFNTMTLGTFLERGRFQNTFRYYPMSPSPGFDSQRNLKIVPQ